MQGCRDLLRYILERTQSLPASDNASSLQLLDTIYEVYIYNQILILYRWTLFINK